MRKLLATMLAAAALLVTGACSAETQSDPKLQDDDAALTEGAVDEQLRTESGAGVQGEVESPTPQ